MKRHEYWALAALIYCLGVFLGALVMGRMAVQDDPDLTRCPLCVVLTES